MPNPLYDLKRSPADFKVIEDLDIDMSGQGEHLWLFVEKQNLTTEIVRHILSKVFDVASDQISAAGKKDRHAITRQWMSIRLPGSSTARRETAISDLESFLRETPLYDQEYLVILEAHLHHKKCQVGCHRGNFFEINAYFSDAVLAQSACALGLTLDEKLKKGIASLTHDGFPNSFGEQRFGGVETLSDMESQLLSISKKSKPGRLKPKDAWACSQVRSYLFNQLLLKRLKRRPILPEVGDVVNIVGSGSCFLVDKDELKDVQERAAKGKLVVTGPLFGRGRNLAPIGAVAETELEVFGRLSVPAQQKLLRYQEAARRPLLVWPQLISSVLLEDYIQLKFWLPKGAYATECVKTLFEYVAPQHGASQTLQTQIVTSQSSEEIS